MQGPFSQELNEALIASTASPGWSPRTAAPLADSRKGPGSGGHGSGADRTAPPEDREDLASSKTV
ncbi:MAG: hypothetical protein ACLTYN_03860 [Dysosmobacter welbionis]